MIFYQVRDWIIPDDIDLPQIEAHHLLTVADFDNDGRLSKVCSSLSLPTRKTKPNNIFLFKNRRHNLKTLNN